MSALLGLPVFGALLPLLAADPAGGGDVALKFAWPAHLRCEVEHSTRASFVAGEPPKGNTVHLALEAVRGGGGWLVRQKVTGTTADEAAPGAPASDGNKKAGKKTSAKADIDPHELEVLLYPPFTVTGDGAFGGLELAAGDRAILERRDAQQRQRAAMIKKLAPDAPLPPSEDALEAATKKASSSWNFLVGAWLGKTLPAGEGAGLRTERDQVVPLAGALHLVDRLTLTRAAPCKPAPRGGCVKLEVTSEPADAAELAARKVHFHSTTTLVTDPRTLIPRSYTRRMEMSAPLPADLAKATGASPAQTRDESNTVIETMTFRCR